MIWIVPIFKHRHDSIAEVAIVLLLVLLLRTQEHILHGTVNFKLSDVLNFKKHGYDQRFLQAGYYFFLLSLDSVGNKLSLGGRLLVGRDAEILTFQLRV
tara:strand:- start:48 stop:344 length:297 start_codon:yes stop_codon:yes gene_type:complete